MKVRPVYKEIFKKYGDSFCIAPWTALYISTSGGMSPCCKYKPFITSNLDVSVKEYINHPNLKNLRKQFLKGKKPKECYDCWNREKCGINKEQLRWSINQTPSDELVNDLLSRTLPDGTIIGEQELAHVDVCWTRKCNFACLSGAPGSSSTILKTSSDVANAFWGKDMRPGTSGLQATQLLEYVRDKKKNNLSKVHLSGGEPFMQEDLVPFLELLLERGWDKDTSLSIHTNGSVTKNYKDIDIVDYLQRWKSDVHITMSIDHCGEKGSYIRPGYNDEVWLNNYHKYTDAGLLIKCQTTLSLLNAPSLGEFSEFCKKNIPNFKSTIGVVQDPRSLAFSNVKLDPKLFAATTKSLKKMSKTHDKIWESNIPMLKQISSHPEEMKNFKQGILLNDKKRNTNFIDIFPEFKTFWNKI